MRHSETTDATIELLAEHCDAKPSVVNYAGALLQLIANNFQVLDITGYHVMFRMCSTNYTASTRAPKHLASSFCAYAHLDEQTNIILPNALLADGIESHTRLLDSVVKLCLSKHHLELVWCVRAAWLRWYRLDQRRLAQLSTMARRLCVALFC